MSYVDSHGDTEKLICAPSAVPLGILRRIRQGVRQMQRVLISMTKGVLNANKLEMYIQVHEEIQSYSESKVNDGPTPMDISGLKGGGAIKGSPSSQGKDTIDKDKTKDKMPPHPWPRRDGQHAQQQQQAGF